LGCWRDLPPATLRDRSYRFNRRLTKPISDKSLPTSLPKLAIGLNSHMLKITNSALWQSIDGASGAKLDN
jgi:hypothetical protein